MRQDAAIHRPAAVPRIVVIVLAAAPVDPNAGGDQPADPPLVDHAAQEAHGRIVAVLLHHRADDARGGVGVEIGSVSHRERVCQSVEISVAAFSLKKNTIKYT